MTKQVYYDECLARIREKKLEDTKRKREQFGYMDGDDSNALPMPDGWVWEPPHGVTREIRLNSGRVIERREFYGLKAYGENYRNLCETQPPYVNPDSAMAGGYYMAMDSLWWNPEHDFSHLRGDIERYAIKHGIDSTQHMCGDVRVGLRLGWGGLLEKVRYWAQWKAPKGEKHRQYYETEETVILSIQTWMRRTIEEIEHQILETNDPMRLSNLRDMRQANINIIDKPPRTLREACQFLAWYNMAGRQVNSEGAGGQLDELLRPYYERDKAQALIDDQDAVYFIASMLMADTKYYQLGGPDETGCDMVSPISWLILQACEKLDVSLNITIRVHDGLPEDFFLHAVSLLFKYRNGWPRFSGDKALVEGCIRNGFTPALAAQRIAVGCNWMAIPGVEYPHNDTMKINCAKCFELAFDEMMTDGETASLDRLWALFEKHLRKAVDIIAKCIDWHMQWQWDNRPDIFLNLFMEGSVQSGLDISNGCASYYNFGVDGMGLSIIADSMAALQLRVEEEKRLSWQQVHQQVVSDFAGQQGEWVRQMMLNSPRYGQGGSIADDWANRTNQLWVDCIHARRTENGIKMTPGWFTWANAVSFGKLVGATPNGRHAGAPLSINANPAPGFRADAAASALSSAVAMAQCGYGNTVPLQLELDPGVSQAQGGVEKVAAMIRAHFDLGGTLININIVDAEKILAADKDPSLYPDLVVRVTGFTAYFASLSPDFRRIVVERLIQSA